VYGLIVYVGLERALKPQTKIYLAIRFNVGIVDK